MQHDENWFTEASHDNGSAFSLKIRQKLHDETTPYQHIEIFATEQFGHLMVIDGFIMLTSRDNFIYHEMLTHPALFTHPQPNKVLIIGGGDCGILREVLKHPEVNHAQQVEIDERVTRVAEQFFPQLCESNHDPRAELHFTDGIEWMKQSPENHYDVIIIDSTDPVGPAKNLFTHEFYAHCYRALGKQGLLVAQSESPLFNMDLIGDMHRAMHKAGFATTKCLFFPQCSYPSGWWTATMASKTTAFTPLRGTAIAEKCFTTQYYNRDIHQAALVAPAFFYANL